MSFRMFSAAAVVLALASSAHGADPSVAYPKGYREWAHVKSMSIVSDRHPLFGMFAGTHHVYVNRAGLAASRAGGKYPEGSVLVFDLLRAEESGGAYTEGDRKLVALMQKDTARFKATGGWGFQAYKGGNPAAPVVTDAAGQCFGCHQAQGGQDFVFSRFRD